MVKKGETPTYPYSLMTGFYFMAQRRLFSPDVVSSDAFLEMPISSQALYFHLGMGADDDGFVNPKRIMRMIGCSDDDLKVLLAKRFVLAFESGVIVLKHWLIHNSIRKDRYHETRYLDEKKTLFIKENNAYSNVWQPNGNQMVPEVKLSEVKLNGGIFKKKLPLPKNMKFYNPDDTGEVLDENQLPIIEESLKKGMASYRLDAENLLKYYNAKYKKEVGTEVPYWPKSAYLKQVKPVLTKYTIEKLKELMDNYFYRDDKITRENKWSISCFLSFKVLNQLNA